MRKISSSLILLLLIFGCNGTNSKEKVTHSPDDVFNDVLNIVIDSITIDIPNKKYIFFVNFESDSIKYWAIDDYMKTLKSVGEYDKVDLLETLRLSFEEDPTLSLRDQDSYRYEILESEKEVANYNEENIIGFFNLSIVVFDKDKKIGCFYIAPQLGEFGVGLYSVFIERDKEKWQVLSLDTMFIGS